MLKALTPVTEDAEDAPDRVEGSADPAVHRLDATCEWWLTERAELQARGERDRSAFVCEWWPPD